MSERARLTELEAVIERGLAHMGGSDGLDRYASLYLRLAYGTAANMVRTARRALLARDGECAFDDVWRYCEALQAPVVLRPYARRAWRRQVRWQERGE